MFVTGAAATNMSTQSTYNANNATAEPAPNYLIRELVAHHCAAKMYPQIHTRLPPEQNGSTHMRYYDRVSVNCLL